LAIAAGISAVFGAPAPSPLKFARLAGRAERSSIGTYGFAAGGLLVEAGKFVHDVAGLQTEPHSATEGLPSTAEDLRSEPYHGREIMTQHGETMTQHAFSPLIARIELPADWRFLLLIPKTAKGLFGNEEREAFARIPPVPLSATEALSREALMNLLPAAIEADFTEFSRSLYRYGRIAGECFASQQHGAFIDRRTAELVDAIRSTGGEGVGQSSWGPTVFVAVAGQDAAHELAARLRSAHDLSDYDTLIARPNNTGARIKTDHIA
jgi:predicted sugar kinase